MLENVTDLPDTPCYRLLSQDGIEEYQLFDPDRCSLARASDPGTSSRKALAVWRRRRMLRGQRQLECASATEAEVRGAQGRYST